MQSFSRDCQAYYRFVNLSVFSHEEIGEIKFNIGLELEHINNAMFFSYLLRLQSVNVAFLGCNTFSDVLSTFKLARIMLGEILSGICL